MAKFVVNYVIYYIEHPYFVTPKRILRTKISFVCKCEHKEDEGTVISEIVPTLVWMTSMLGNLSNFMFILAPVIFFLCLFHCLRKL